MCLPDGAEVRGRVGANGAQHCSFVLHGDRFYNVIEWSFAPLPRLTPRGEAGCRPSTPIAAPGAPQPPRHQPDGGRDARSLGGCARVCRNRCVFEASTHYKLQIRLCGYNVGSTMRSQPTFIQRIE